MVVGQLPKASLSRHLTAQGWGPTVRGPGVSISLGFYSLHWRDAASPRCSPHLCPAVSPADGTPQAPGSPNLGLPSCRSHTAQGFLGVRPLSPAHTGAKKDTLQGGWSGHRGLPGRHLGWFPASCLGAHVLDLALQPPLKIGGHLLSSQ